MGSLSKRRERWFYLFVAPWLAGFLIFRLGPIGGAFLLSFAEWPLPQPPQWVGLQHFRTLWNDDLFRRTLLNTLYYAVGTTPTGIAIGLALALLLERPRAGVGLFRSMLLLPVVVSGVAMTLLWAWIFNPRFGPINTLLAMVGIPGPGWLHDEHWAMPALILIGLWTVGINMMIYLAALNDIPHTLREAAALDGAGAWTIFRRILWPLLSPATLYLSVVNIIGAFQVFTATYILTEGGPRNATLTLPLYIYFNAFTWSKPGYAAALAFVLFLVVLLLTRLQFQLASRWVFYRGGA
jgi:multiple sugar transport system permease protein